MKIGRLRKSGFIISIAMLLIVAFTFLATFQTTEAVAASIRQSSVNSSINLDKNRTDSDDFSVYEEQELFDEPYYDETEIIGEDVSKRTETSKTFVQADGTFVLQEYGTSVHYLQGDEYLDIDNTLNESLENTANSFKVNFNNGSRDSLVSITSEHGSISMTPILTETQAKGSADIHVYDGSKNTQTVANSKSSLVRDLENGVGKSDVSNKSQKDLDNSQTPTKKQDISARSKLPDYDKNFSSALDSLNLSNERLKTNLSNTFAKHNSAVLYENLISGVDFQYILEGQSLKENIIVNSQMAEYVFRFELNLENLVPYLSSSGDILITNQKGELVYTIPKGYMLDANGEHSDDVKYELSYDPFGISYLTVIADEAFFETAAFPVVVDPSIVLFSESSMITGHHHDSNSNLETDHFKIHWHPFIFVHYYYYAYIELNAQDIAKKSTAKI